MQLIKHPLTVLFFGTFQACEFCTKRLYSILFLLTKPLTLQTLQKMPKHDKKRKHVDDETTPLMASRDAGGQTSSDDDCPEMLPIVTEQDIDPLELNVQEDTVEEMDISFQQVWRKRLPEDDTIEQLVGETGRLEMKDDMDREKFGY